MFRYNTAVVNVNTTVVRNVYVDRTVINNTVVNRASFNGAGGVVARPSHSGTDLRPGTARRGFSKSDLSWLGWRAAIVLSWLP